MSNYYETSNIHDGEPGQNVEPDDEYMVDMEVFPLSPGLSVETLDNGKELALHLDVPFDTSHGQLRATVREGLTQLVKLLKTDIDFLPTEKITATSWMVTVNPGIFKRLGFVVDNESEIAKRHIKGYLEGKSEVELPERAKRLLPSYAYITKDNLINIVSAREFKLGGVKS